jgi:hypothetical protein
LRRLERLIDTLLNVAGSRIIAAVQGRSHAIVADVGQQLRLLLTRADERATARGWRADTPDGPCRRKVVAADRISRRDSWADSRRSPVASRDAGDRHRLVRESPISLLRHPGLAQAGEKVLAVGDHDRNIRAGIEIGSILSEGRELPARQRGVALVQFARFGVTSEIGERCRLNPQDLTIVRQESQGLFQQNGRFRVASENHERQGLE